MPGGKKQRRVKSTQTPDSLKRKPDDELFLFGGSILSLSLKWEEFENKVEAALKLWKEQKEEREMDSIARTGTQNYYQMRT